MSDAKLRILFLTYQGDMAGSTNSISYLCRGLAKLGHEVYLGIRKESLLWRLVEGSEVRRVPMSFKGKFDRENWKQIAQVVQDHQIQLINAQSSIDRYTAIFAKWKYRLNCKIIHTRRQNPLSAGGWLQKIFYVRNTEKIVVISNGLKETFIQKGYPAEHLQVIHNGIPTQRFEQWDEKTVEAYKQKLQLSPNKKVIGCVSRLKEQDQIIQAVAGLQDPTIELLFVGVKEKDLQPYVEQYGLTNTVHIIPEVPSSEILNLYRLMDMNILASTMDGFGLVLIEAMGMSCPVIATRFGGIKDVVQDGHNGYLFENGHIEDLQQKIKSLLTDQERRETFIQNGLHTALERFTIANTIRQYEQFFHETITPNRPKVLFLTYQGDIAGATNSIAYLSKGLTDRGMDIYAGIRRESRLWKLLEESKVKRVAMNFKGKFNPKAWLEIKKAVRANQIDIINAQSSIDRYTSIFANWFFGLGCQVVHTRRQMPMSSGFFLQMFLYNRKTAGIIAVSQQVKKALTSIGIKKEKIKVINNGTPPEKYQRVDPQQVAILRKRLQIEEDDFVLGCVSRLKNQVQVLQALEKIHDPLTMVFCGIEPNPEMEEIIQGLTSPHRIIFEGPIAEDYILNYYGLFHAHVLASTQEGLSQSLLEAMALDVPVIATGSGGNLDLIENKINGLLFEDGNIDQLADHINSIRHKPQLAQKLKTQAKHTALGTYNISHTIAQYEQYFKNL
jgi:glycosyltransferase involved in cell wall biosynthesis